MPGSPRTANPGLFTPDNSKITIKSAADGKVRHLSDWDDIQIVLPGEHFEYLQDVASVAGLLITTKAGSWQA